MAMGCTKVTEWIRQNISKPIEDWEERTEKKCKKRKWYDPRRWLCWLVTNLVKVIRWIIVTVVTAVITFVCHLTADLLSIIWNALKFLGNLFLALVTWDKCRLQAALGNLGDALIGFGEIMGDVLIRPITDRIQTFRLRRHVGEEIDKRFADQPELAEAIKQNLGVNTGVFGYRLTVPVYRLFVDSETRTPQSGEVPNLIFLHESGLIDLFRLAGFDRNCAIFDKEGWRRSLPRTARKTFAGGGGSLIETDPPEISRDDLEEFINSRGAKGPPFLILAMSIGALNNRIEAAETKGRQLGLIFSFEKRLKEVTDPQFISLKSSAILPGDPAQIDCATKQKAQTDLLICELGRRPEIPFVCCPWAGMRADLPADRNGAFADLCGPVAAGVFDYSDSSLSGLATNLVGTSGMDHDLLDGITSGVTFRAQIPERVRQYVLIHELGHYFGLTHVDGFDRLMVSGAEDQGDVFTWDSIPNIFWHGGPRFIYVEAERVWDFILTNFPTSCLAPRVPVGGVIL